MNSGFRTPEQAHVVGDNAAHPIEPRWRTLAALLLLAGSSPQRVRPRRRHICTVKVRVRVSQGPVAESNCVVARRGGEQLEANWRSAG